MQFPNNEIGWDHPSTEQHRKNNKVEYQITAHQISFRHRISHRYREEQINDSSDYRNINRNSYTAHNRICRKGKPVCIK